MRLSRSVIRLRPTLVDCRRIAATSIACLTRLSVALLSLRSDRDFSFSFHVRFQCCVALLTDSS